MTPTMPRDPRTYRGEPSRDELVAAQQVVDMFASEALLALDRFERSFPATATDRERQVADRLTYWWQKLELDEVRPDPRGSDAEQILGAAADLSREAPAPRKVKHPKAAIELHPDFAAALDKAPKAKAALDGFSPSARRDYLEWIADAKQDATRQKRIATAVEWLSEGKKRHWKYEKC